MTKDIKSLALCLAQAVCKLSDKLPFVTSQGVAEAFRDQEIDSKSKLLKGMLLNLRRLFTP